MARILENRIAFVTGAASGIGRQIAGDFAREGARVCIADLDEPAARAAAAAIREDGGQAMAVRCDVTREPELAAALDEALAAWGRLDILVNNAGLQHVAPLEEFPAEKFELLLRVMLIAPFLATKRVFPLMKRQRHGRIGLTRVAALEGAAHGITVNALCPGYVDTPLVKNQLGDLARTRGVPVERVLEDVIYPLVPIRRLLTPLEIAGYAVFLAGEQAGGVTGQAVVIDGGYTTQ